MTFNEQLILTFVDKGALALLIVLAGFFLNRSIVRFKGEQMREAESDRVRNARRLEYLEKQLSEFYWPLYVLLRADQSVYEHMKKLASSGSGEAIATAARIEEQFIRQNRDTICKIIQSKIHLMEGDTPAFRDMLQFVKDVAASSAIWSASDATARTTLLSFATPQPLIDRITETAYDLQSQYDSLLVAKSNGKRSV